MIADPKDLANVSMMSITLLKEQEEKLSKEFEREVSRVAELFAPRLNELQEAIKKHEKSLKTVMKECRQSIFAVGDRLDLPAGSLLHLVGEKLKISRTTLELLEEHGFVEGIKIAKSVDRGALETWPKEKLVQVAAEMKPTEEFTYELKGDRDATETDQ